MKTFSCLLFACAFTVSVWADDAKTNSMPDMKSSGTNSMAAAVAPLTLTFPITAATVTGPFTLTNGVVSTAEQHEVNDSGKAAINFTITNAGDYVLKGIVNAPDESANSFYLNIDAQPQDPVMIWDMSVTSGFEERVVSWRGSGDQDSDEFSPKVFNLKAGAHQLIIVAREAGAELKSVSIVSQPAK